MKGILEFNLPEDRDDFNLAQRAASYYIALTELSEYLRRSIKYASPNEGEHPEIFESRIQAYEHIRSLFYQTLNDQGIELS